MTELLAQRFHGKNVVVTGAASGIGAAVADRFAHEGARVVAVDLVPSGDAMRAAIVAVQADVSAEAGWGAVSAAVAELGGADVLISNAALQLPAPAHELSIEDWNRQLDVNVRGTFLGLRALVADLSARRGCVVAMSSVHALFGLPAHPAYAASKGALLALVRQVAVDYAPVRVNCIVPGPIRTPAWDRVPTADRERSVNQTALKRFGEPAEVAAVASFLASDEASFITGASIVVDGGWSVVKEGA